MQQENSFARASRMASNRENSEKWPKLLFIIIILLFAVAEW